MFSEIQEGFLASPPPPFNPVRFVFKGPAQTSLDDKGRLSMPTRFRDAFALYGNKFTITRHPDGCLVILPPPAWEALAAQIEQMPLAQHGTKRMFYGHAMDLELDKAGRVTIPPELRTTAGMKPNGSVMLMGMGRYLEMWDGDMNKARDDADRQKPDTMSGVVL